MTKDQLNLAIKQSVGQYHELLLEEVDSILTTMNEMQKANGGDGKVVLRFSHTAAFDDSAKEVKDKLTYGARHVSTRQCKMVDTEQPTLFDGDTAERAPMEGED